MSDAGFQARHAAVYQLVGMVRTGAFWSLPEWVRVVRNSISVKTLLDVKSSFSIQYQYPVYLILVKLSFGRSGLECT